MSTFYQLLLFWSMGHQRSRKRMVANTCSLQIEGSPGGALVDSEHMW